ncbi:uncharacterized protein MELLADRAFT_114422 [Melampsora larici-populina 98AG31]|uniref:Uncharacterized protein n=1 Tax=Melampsora larici-populina (strain 98AG31 / pathotype 3-4-7) TaxID=747676 RepID=F4SDE3_MELLP|nr:uncharacterized protein MELLADRAFT_114422 [Melampsora larici-populina 98AG31]EGF97333.1 hypothetical protein MELLADRAFT_114422 [Melampsora larici-populina 98AG31]
MASQASPTQQRMLIKSHALLEANPLSITKHLVDSKLLTGDKGTQDSSAANSSNPGMCSQNRLLEKGIENSYRTASKIVTGFVCESYLRALENLKQSLCELPGSMTMTTALASTFSAVLIQISKEISEIEAGTFEDTFGGDVHTLVPPFQSSNRVKSSASMLLVQSSSQKHALDYIGHVKGSTTSRVEKRMKIATGQIPSCKHHDLQKSLL